MNPPPQCKKNSGGALEKKSSVEINSSGTLENKSSVEIISGGTLELELA